MVRPLFFAALCLFATDATGWAGLDMAPSQFGFGYCPPPIVPSCIETNARRRTRPAMEACSRDVLRFTQTLGAYRACLTRESERAIGTGNDAIARFRCLSQGGTACR